MNSKLKTGTDTQPVPVSFYTFVVGAHLLLGVNCTLSGGSSASVCESVFCGRSERSFLTTGYFSISRLLTAKKKMQSEL